MKISVILSTYNQPEWLEKVIWGYSAQTHKDFGIVVADDGSDEATRLLLKRLRAETGLNIARVWHEHDGFQKTRILNKAIMAAGAEYLVFSDGDCVPRNDFLAVHAGNAAKGFFLSGGYFKLPMGISQAVTKEDILQGKMFDLQWLRERGLKRSLKNLKLTAGKSARFLNAITPTNATWNGHNASGWKTDIVAVNGFDEEMKYGGEDRELGERMMNNGIKGRQIRYSAIVVHLDHKRGYATPEALAKNLAIRRRTRQTKAVWTDHGIIKKP